MQKPLSLEHEQRKLRSIRFQGFATRFRLWRESQGLSRADIANALGMHHNSPFLWENGETTPRAETMIELARIYNIDWHYILTGAPPRGVQVEAVRKAHEILTQALAQDMAPRDLGYIPKASPGKRQRRTPAQSTLTHSAPHNTLHAPHSTQNTTAGQGTDAGSE